MAGGGGGGGGGHGRPTFDKTKNVSSISAVGAARSTVDS